MLFFAKSTHEVPNFEWILFALRTIFSCLNAMFVAPLTWAVTGELLPQSVKAIGSSLAVASSSFGRFLGAKIFLPVSSAFGIYVNFIIFLVNLVLFLYVYFDLPETRVFLVKFMTGLGLGWVAPMLHQLKNSPETSFTSEECAWIASAHYITRAFSPLLVMVTIDRLGRNVTLVISAFISFVMWIAVYASRLVYVHYAVRLFFGISVGFCEAAGPIYLAENCDTKLRGISNGVGTAFFYLGELIAFVLAAYLSYEWFAVSNSLLGLAVLLSTFFLKEPAQYLIMKGNLTRAEKNYDYLYDLKRPKTKGEFEDIKQYVNEVKTRKFSWRMLRAREVSKSLRIVLIISFLSLAGGFTAVNAFITIALANASSEGISTSNLTILFGLAQFFTILLSSALMDTFGRRTLFLFSSATIVINHAATAVLYYASLTYEVPNFNWILFALLTIFSCLDGMFMGPLTSAVTGELLPQNVKAVGSSLAVASSSLGGFLGAKIYLPVSDAFGIYVNFIIFSFVNLIMFVYVYFDLPETKVFLIKFMTGLGLGWVAPMLHQLKNSSETSFTSEECAWIASGHYITRGVSPFLVMVTIDRLGRNVTLVISAFISFVMWIVVYASQLVYVHYAVRLFFGISVGFSEVATPIYLGENCDTKLRGISNSLGVAFLYVGELIAFISAAYLSYEWFAVCNGVLGLTVLLSTFFLKEPAQYLIMKGNLTKAERNYDYLYDLKRPKTKGEFEDIKRYVNDEVKTRKFSWRMLRAKEVSKSLRVVLIVCFLSLAGGFTAVNSFVTIALADAGPVGTSTSDFTILFGLAQLSTILLSSPFMDTFGRRTLFLFSSAAIVINHAAIAILYYVSFAYEVPNLNWILFALFTIYSCLAGMFIGPLTSAIMGELLPLNVKAIGSSLGVVSSSLGGFLGAKIFLPVSDAFGIHVNFIVFSFMNLLLFLCVYFDLPETKGKTLVDIQKELKSEKGETTIVESTRL